MDNNWQVDDFVPYALSQNNVLVVPEEPMGDYGSGHLNSVELRKSGINKEVLTWIDNGVSMGFDGPSIRCEKNVGPRSQTEFVQL